MTLCSFSNSKTKKTKTNNKTVTFQISQRNNKIKTQGKENAFR